jgi:SH3-like domain-containing protein
MPMPIKSSITRLACLLAIVAIAVPVVAAELSAPSSAPKPSSAPAADGEAVKMAAASATMPGSVSGLPVPRYVSLKSDRVNLREGPSKDHRVAWVFQKAGLPVEVIAEFDTWRRIRDAEGTEGWVLHSLLSGRRTAVVAPWEKGKTFEMHHGTEPQSDIVARLEAGVIANVGSCDGTWCHVSVRDVSGYLKQDRLWGVYPHEHVD